MLGNVTTAPQTSWDDLRSLMLVVGRSTEAVDALQKLVAQAKALQETAAESQARAEKALTALEVNRKALAERETALAAAEAAGQAAADFLNGFNGPNAPTADP